MYEYNLKRFWKLTDSESVKNRTTDFEFTESVRFPEIPHYFGGRYQSLKFQ